MYSWLKHTDYWEVNRMEHATLYALEGSLIRVRARDPVPEIYFGDGQWSPYLNTERLKQAQPITEEAAKPLMAASDTPQCH